MCFSVFETTRKTTQVPAKGAKYMKRITAILLAAVLAFAMTACGGDAQSGAKPAEEEHSAGSGPSAPESELPERDLITGGALSDYTKEGGRPAAIMIDNARAALPQRGIGSADALFEMVAEGGITRLMALFSNPNDVPLIGPVRSARDQHLQCALPMRSLIVHIGTSIYAENLLSQYAYPTVNGLYLGTTSFVFDEGRKNEGYHNEHCWYTDAEKIAAGIEKSGIDPNGAGKSLFAFVPEGSDAVVPEQGDAPEVAISFSPSAAVTLTYDGESGKYGKTAYGEPHLDAETGEQLCFENVLVLFTEVRRKNPDDPNNIVMDFDMSAGSGYYCYGGKYRKVEWKKGAPEDPIRFTDEQGNAVQINTGKSYVAIVGNDCRETLLLGGVNPQAAEDGETQDAASEAPAE